MTLVSSVRSVNLAASGGDRTSLPGSGIDKQPEAGPVRVTRDGLVGDRIVNGRHHGGVDQAVYAYAREDLDHFAEVLGIELADGHFGENLTTQGIEVNEALLGETWRVGGTLLEVASARVPCANFKAWMGFTGYDDTAWVRRFAEADRPGAYLRVLEEGQVRAGDALHVEHRPDHDVTVRTAFRALTTQRELLPRLLAVDGLAARVRRRAEAYLGSADAPPGLATRG